jgi:hypothetical protein
MQPTNIRERVNPEQLKYKKREKQKIIDENSDDNNNNDDDDQQRTRSIDEVLFLVNFIFSYFVFKLREMLKSLVRNRYKDIEDEFKKIDRGSYGELTPDFLYDLFKRFVYLFLFK